MLLSELDLTYDIEDFRKVLEKSSYCIEVES